MSVVAIVLVIVAAAVLLVAVSIAVPSVAARIGAIVTRGLVALLHVYQTYVSPALPPTCRFYPSCSAFAVEALQVHGVVRGIGLTTWRLLRCHPWHPGGVDPVPPPRGDRTHATRICTAEDHLEEQAPC